MIGQNVCRHHGGASPQARRRVARDRANARAMRDLARLGEVQPVADPLRELQKLAGEVSALRDILRGRVAELGAIATTNRAGDQQVHALLSAYERSLDRTAAVLGTIARLDIDARLVAVDRDIAVLMWAVEQAFVEWLGLRDDDEKAAHEAWHKLTDALGEMPADRDGMVRLRLGYASSLIKAARLPDPPKAYQVEKIVIEVERPTVPTLPRKVIEPPRAAVVVDAEPLDDPGPGADPAGPSSARPSPAQRVGNDEDVRRGIATLRGMSRGGFA